MLWVCSKPGGAAKPSALKSSRFCSHLICDMGKRDDSLMVSAWESLLTVFTLFSLRVLRKVLTSVLFFWGALVNYDFATFYALMFWGEGRESQRAQICSVGWFCVINPPTMATNMKSLNEHGVGKRCETSAHISIASWL